MIRIVVLIAAAWLGQAAIGSVAGTASIAGVVVTPGENGQPVRRAVVTITGDPLLTNLSSVTDDRGRFAFERLAPGRYSASVSKAGYLTTAYGATRPGRPGTSVVIATGKITELRMAIHPGAVITGTVRDLFGRPAAGVQVTVSPAELVNATGGFRELSDPLVTDDRGVYRAYGLAPGDYVVSAIPRVPGSGAITRPSRAEVDAQLRALEQRGTTASVTAPPPTDAAAFGFAPTYYPGTTVAADAARVSVGAGDERAGVDVPLAPVRTARVAGTIISSTQEVLVTRLRPSLSLLGPPQPTLSAPSLSGPTADGAFSFTNVPPGRYLLVVRSGPGAMMATATGSGATTTNPGIPALFAMQEMSVDGSDVGGLTLSLRPAASFSGKVAFDGATLSPPEKLAAIRIALTPLGAVATPTMLNNVMLGTPSPASVTLKDDGTFTMPGVLPGGYTASATIPGGASPTGWWLRSVIVNGRDVLDAPLEVDASGTDIGGAVFTFIDRHNEFAGSLVTAAGQPADSFTVLVAPADRALWRAGSRRLRALRPGSDGRFSTPDLPSGEYLVAAVTDLEQDRWQTIQFLEAIAAAAVKVVVVDGQRTVQDLRIAR